jgi:hypothetical protein
MASARIIDDTGIDAHSSRLNQLPQTTASY